MRFLLVLLLLTCVSHAQDKMFLKGNDIHIVFDRPFLTANGMPINPVWLGYDVEIRSFADSTQWFRMWSNLKSSSDKVSFPKRTDNMIVGPIYQHRVRSVIEPRQEIMTRTDTTFYAGGISDWVLSPTYALTDIVTAQPETLVVNPDEVKQILIIK